MPVAGYAFAYPICTAVGASYRLTAPSIRNSNAGPERLATGRGLPLYLGFSSSPKLFDKRMRLSCMPAARSSPVTPLKPAPR